MIDRFRRATAVSLIVLTGHVNAFDGMEHERIADSAILLATAFWVTHYKHIELTERATLCEYLEARFGATSIVTLVRHCPELLADIRENRGESDPFGETGVHLVPQEAVTYGGIVRLVDELIYPSQIFVREGSINTFDPMLEPVSAEEGNRFLARSYLELNHRFHKRREIRRIWRGTNAVLEGYRALAYNEIHFQNDLLQQMHRFRREARFTAQQALYFSLVSNALSDHFLQDYLAPGHILWPRNHSHDSVAISVHDGTNQKGAWFRLDESLDDDEGLLWKLGAYMAALPEGSEEQTTLQNYWMKRRSRADYDCESEFQVDGDGDLAGTPEEGWLCLQAAVENNGRFVRLYGDGLVSRSPAQQALMVMIQAERILELLLRHEAKQAGEAIFTSNPDTSDNAIASFDAEYETLLVPCTGQEFGDYRFVPVDDCAEQDERSEEIFRDTASGVILIGGGGQTPIDNVGTSRRHFWLEYLPLRFMANSNRFRNAAIHKPPEHCDFFSWCNTGFVFGADHVANDRFDAFGGGARLIKAVPAINLQFSLYAKYLKYDYLQFDSWKTSYGVRADWGFSIGSLYIAAGSEYVVNDADRLQSTGMISFGVGFGIPNTRIRKWFSDNRNYRPERDY